MATARYLPERGGTEIHTHEVASRLAARGLDVTVATTARGDFPRETMEDGVRVVRVRAWPPNRDYYLAPALAQIVRASRHDLLHCQGYHTLVAPLAMMAALTSGIPYFVTLHSGGHSSRVRTGLRPAQAWMLRPLLGRAQRLIAVSEFEADLFSRRLRTPRAGFAVIPSGVELPHGASGGPGDGPPLILSVGRLENYKGHHRIVEALPALAAARPGSRVRLVGAGPYEGELRNLARRLGVAHLVEIAGVPSNDRAAMATLLQQASVVTLLSDYESQGLAVQEALALGRPLVVSRGTALEELERHPNVIALARSAGSADIARAILSLADSPPGTAPALPTWDDCVSALLDLYEQALAERR